MKAFRASGISGVCYDDRRASIYLEISLLYLKRRLFGGVITVYPTAMEQDSTLSSTQHLPQSASAVSAQCLTVTQDFRDADGRWYVMLSANPKGTEMELAHENARRVQENQPMLLAFSPYLFLTQGIDTENEKFITQAVKAHYTTSRAVVVGAMRRFFFFKGCRKQLEQLCTGSNSLFATLRFYNDRNKRHITISTAEMRCFIDVCCDEKLRVEVSPTLEHLEKNEEVILNTTELKGHKGFVVGVKHSANGITLQVAVTMFSRLLTVKLLNLKETDVIRPNLPKQYQEDRLLDTVKAKLLDIMERRLASKQDEKKRLDDAATLDKIYNYRFHQFDTPARNRPFLAMMLICAWLRHDAEGCAYFQQQVMSELTSIEKEPDKTKSQTDVRAYMQVALYLSTGEASYRNAAKLYVQTHQPKSAILRKFVGIIRKKRVK